MQQPTYTAAEVDAAVQVLGDPARMAHAQEVVTHAAPSLQHILVDALAQGGWFSEAHDQQVSQAACLSDEHERLRAVSALLAEETRLGMLVGVAVGFELAHQLQQAREDRRVTGAPEDPSRPNQDSSKATGKE